MKSVGFMVAGAFGQVVAVVAFMGLGHLYPDLSDRLLLDLFTTTLAIIGAVATVGAGWAAKGTGRVWALAVSGLFFTAVVVYVAAAAYSLYEHQ